MSYVTIADLRYDLKQIKELATAVNIDDIPDDLVIVMHDQIMNAGHPDAPDWYKKDIEFWLNLIRSGVSDYEQRIKGMKADIKELQARLGGATDYIAKTG